MSESEKVGASGAEEIQRNLVSLWPLPTGPSLMPLVIHPEWTQSPGSSEDSPESWECGALEGVAGIAPHMRLGLWGSATGPGTEAGPGRFAV